jgi:hypothetical protein
MSGGAAWVGISPGSVSTAFSIVRKCGDVLTTLREAVTNNLQETIAVRDPNGYVSVDGHGSVVVMGEKPRTPDTGPASTSETKEIRTETTEFRTSSDVQTSTSAKDEAVRDQGEEARDDQRDRKDENVRDEDGGARDDRRDRKDENVRDQGEEVRDDQGDQGDSTSGSSLGSKLGDALGLGHHGDRVDRDGTE